jgi:hypothetical protein
VAHLSNYIEAKDKATVQQAIIDVILKNPHPELSSLKELADKTDTSVDNLTLEMMMLLRDFFGAGLSVQNKNAVIDPNQLTAGIKVEMEHTTNPLIAKKISHDHLTETSDYYTKLSQAGL